MSDEDERGEIFSRIGRRAMLASWCMGKSAMRIPRGNRDFMFPARWQQCTLDVYIFGPRDIFHKTSDRYLFTDTVRVFEKHRADQNTEPAKRA
jgi:hypothetical protein